MKNIIKDKIAHIGYTIFQTQALLKREYGKIDNHNRRLRIASIMTAIILLCAVLCACGSGSANSSSSNTNQKEEANTDFSNSNLEETPATEATLESEVENGSDQESEEAKTDEVQTLQMDDGNAASEEAGTENSAEQTEDNSQDENNKSEVKREHESEYTKLIYNNYDCIRVVQEALNDAGYSCGSPDGMIGEGTKKAISDFQRDHGLEETGEVNDELIDVLGCWDKADLCFYFRATSDREGRNPTSHFGKSDQWYHWATFANRGRAGEMAFYFKAESSQGFVHYPDTTLSYDDDGNPTLGYSLWFDNPGDSPASTITSTITDENNNVLAKITINVG